MEAEAKAYSRAIIATDGSDYSMKAAIKASQLFKTGMLTHLTIVNVAESYKNLEVLTSLKEVLTEDAEEIIKKTLEIMPFKEGVQTEILYGDPDNEICKYAKENDIDLIIMGAKGRSAMMNVLMGSTSSQTLYKAPCSVLIIRNPKYY